MTTMNQIKVNGDKLTALERIERGHEIIAALRANQNLSDGEKARLIAKIEGPSNALQARVLERGQAEFALKATIVEQNRAMENWKSALTSLASEIAALAQGDGAVMRANGFAFAKSKQTRKTRPHPVEGLRLSVGPRPGTVWAHWDGQKEATRYALQLCQSENFLDAQWLNGPAMGGRKTKFLLEDLQSRMRYWVRAQALNTHIGAWSAPASIIVP